jgi:hypothetical protein
MNRSIQMHVIAALVCALMMAVFASSASAQAWDPNQFGFEVTETGRVGSSDAGAHPTVWTRFRFKNVPAPPGSDFTGPIAQGTPKFVAVDMPYGLVGNPLAVPKCKREDFLRLQCPPQTQIGVAHPQPGGFPEPFRNRPIYNLEPDGTGPTLFGIDVLGIIGNFAYLRVQVRADGGLRTVTDPFPRGTPLVENKLELWGVPADMNACNPNNPGFDPDAPSPYELGGFAPCPVTDPEDWERKPLMTSPTDCETVPMSILRSESYEGKKTQFQVSQPHAPLNCDSLVFEPSIEVKPTNPAADSASGLTVDVNVPQNDDPDERATPRVRHVRMTLPEGVSLNPGAAQGLEACPDATFGKGVEAPASCPEKSKVGRVSITSPLLEDPLPGDIYIGQPQPGNRFRLFVYARGHGVIIKLIGTLRPDPQTGQITASFEDAPPLPFSNFHLEFRSGESGVLAMPQTCGTHTARAEVTPYSSRTPEVVTSAFQIGAGAVGCPATLPFAPTFSAGSAPAVGGAFSPFAVSFTKPDGHQPLGGIEIELPTGLLAKVKDVPLCPEADAAAGTCPVESRVGTVKAGSGPGSGALFLDGTASLTGSYKGAPYGLSIAVPAVAGPYDLGMVVVRQRVEVDPVDASLKVISDPLPTILEGVPLRLQRIDVNMNRPGFMVTPTSCVPKEIKTTFTSTSGTAASMTVPYQVGDCSKLPLRPRMTMKMTGRKQLTDGKHPGLEVTVTQPEGQAHLRRVAAKLPLSLALEPENARALCGYEAGLRVECPRSSIIGRATAVSPLLKRPLSGNVYFVQGVRFHPRTGARIRTLPTLLIPLRGEIALNLRATSDTQRGKLVSTFQTIPDAALSRFRLSLRGGSNGILAATTSICGKKHVAVIEMDGHNGKRSDRRVRLGTPCKARAGGRGR